MQFPIQTRKAADLDLRQPVRRSTKSRPLRLLLGTFVFWIVGAIAMGTSVFAVQDAGPSLREFSAPTPSQLFRILSTYDPNRASQSPMDSNRMSELEQKGRDFLSSLSPEEQETALRFAEKYLGENGVDSPASKALMSQFGVPTELQENLAEQFREMQNPGQRQNSEFRDKLRRATERAIEQSRQRETRSSVNQNERRSTPKKPDEKTNGGSQQPGRDPSTTKPPVADPAAADPSSQDQSLDGQTTTGQSPPGQLTDERAKPDSEKPGQSIEDPGSASRDVDREIKRPSKKLPSGNAGKSAKRNVGDPAGENPLQRLGQPGPGSDSSLPDRSDASQPSDGKHGSGFDWEKKLRELVGQRTRPEKPDDGNAPTRRTGSENGSAAIDAQAQAKFLEAIERITSEGPASGNRDLLKGVGKTLSGATNDSTESKERLTARFDRLLVDAAKRSLNSKTGISPDVEMPESGESLFDRFIDKVHKSVTKSNRSKPKRSQVETPNIDWRSSNNNPPPRPASPDRTKDLAQNDSSPILDLDDPSTQTNEISPAGGDPGKLLDSFSEMPKFDAKVAFTFVAIVGLVFFLAYILIRNVAIDQTAATKRKFGKRFRNAKIQSQQDLVEAVDFFLISKFGSDSSWWNAKHAHNVLCAGAPEYDAKINDLIKQYTRARYMRAEVVLSESEQQSHKTTLQDLARLAELPVSGKATRTEG